MAVRQTARVPFPDFIAGLPESHREVDPAAVLAAVHALLDGMPACDAVVVCGQMHGFVLVNERGEAMSNYVSWLDQRVSASEFSGMAARLTEQDLAEIGNEFRASIAVCQLAHAKPTDVTPVTIADYVIGRLCGVAPVMEPTQAAAFGALRLGTLEWHDGVIGKLGLEGVRWPRVVPSGSVVGHWRGTPVYASVGDQQCALAGALLRDREISVNIGTGSQVAMLVDRMSADGVQTRPYFGGRFLRTITHIPGGRALSALLGLLGELGAVGEEEAWRKIEEAVAGTPGTDVSASIAYYPGPCGDSGWFRGLREDNLTVGHLFRAVFESMAGNYRECAGRLDPGRLAEGIVFSGGVARRNALLRELTGVAIGLPSRLSPHPEDTMYGLLVLGKSVLGNLMIGKSVL